MKRGTPALSTLRALTSVALGAATLCAACEAPKPPREVQQNPILTAPPLPLSNPAPAQAAPSPLRHTIPPPSDPTRRALGLPLPQTPEPVQAQVDNSYTFSFYTSLSVNALDGFIRNTLPSHTISRFPTGALRASPPDNDGVEVSVTPTRATQRLVTYRRVYPTDPSLYAAPPHPGEAALSPTVDASAQATDPGDTNLTTDDSPSTYTAH